MTTPPAFEVRYKGRKLRKNFLGELVAKLPVRQRAPALKHAAEFMLIKFKQYPAYKHVTRRAAYGGNGFQSDEQRRFIMASLRAGRNLKTGTPMEPGFPHRTGKIRRAWEIQGKGVDISIVNTSPAAPFLMSPVYQASQPRLVGWQDVNAITEANIDEMGADLLEYVNEITPEIVDEILNGL